MMKALNILLFLCLINLTVSQTLPNPKRYQITIKKDSQSEEYYGIDKIYNKVSHKGFSIKDNQLLLTFQDIYVPFEGRTYSFKLSYPPGDCIVNRGSPFNYLDYWNDIVKSYGKDNRTYDEIVFDEDCHGDCLVWKLEFDSTAVGYTIKNKLFIQKSNLTPIKLISNLYQIYTETFVGTYLTKYSNWSLDEIPDSQYDFPMDINKCYYA